MRLLMLLQTFKLFTLPPRTKNTCYKTILYSGVLTTKIKRNRTLHLLIIFLQSRSKYANIQQYDYINRHLKLKSRKTKNMICYNISKINNIRKLTFIFTILCRYWLTISILYKFCKTNFVLVRQCLYIDIYCKPS